MTPSDELRMPRRVPVRAVHGRAMVVLALAAMFGAAASCERAPSAAPGSPRGEPAPREPLRIAAASDLRFVLDEVVAAMPSDDAWPPIEIVYGASGTLFAQCENGAPFDLLLSADMEYPRRLTESGAAVAETLVEYARGRLVLWLPADSPVDPAVLGSDALLDVRVRRIAIANPQHAPYGRAALAALESLGLLDRVRSRLVIAENTAQAAQFVQSGAAEAGVIPHSLASAPALRDTGRTWPVPSEAHAPIRQGGVVLARATHRAAAERVLRFLSGARGRAMLAQNGFDPPD